MAASIQGELRNYQVEEIFPLLESTDQQAREEIRKLILEDINNCGSKESWLLNSCFDHYLSTKSESVQQLLPEVRDPQSKHLLDRINDGIRTVNHKMACLQLLLNIVCKQPQWTHRIVCLPVFNTLIKCLKTETDIPVLMTSVMILTLLLPVVPVAIAKHLHEILDILTRLASFCVRKPANTPDVYLLHLHVSLYSLFHRLYGMYPFTFLQYVHHQFNKKELVPVFEEIVHPMLERVRLHPQLISGSREEETSTSRWKHLETQDIVIECAKLSLDIVEGTRDDYPTPAFIKRYQTVQEVVKSRHNSDNTNQDTSLMFSGGIFDSSHHILASFGNDPNLVCSPSVVIGLSTPPQSQCTTPATNIIDTCRQFPSTSGTVGNTPMLTPKEITPRQTPNITDEQSNRTSSRTSAFHKSSDSKRLGAGLQAKSSSLDPKLTPGSQVTPGAMVTPSPLKTEFTQEPPKGAVKTKPRNAIRALEFDHSPDKEEVPNKRPLSTQNSIEEAKAVTMDTLEGFVDELPTHENECIDHEVSQITQEDDLEGSFETIPSPEITHAMAESVKQFMKKVNRIRFNSLNATSERNEKKNHVRSNSCPPFEEENQSDEDDIRDFASRSISTSVEEQVPMTSSSVTSVPTTDKQMMVTRVKLEKKKVRQPSGNSDIVELFEPSNLGPPFSLISQALLAPSDVTVCSACHSKLLHRNISEASQEIPIFATLSPPEILDRHLRIGGEVHAKELNRIPLTSKESVNWTHFGGVPPADEVNILKGQNILLHNQVMYERYKRDLHAKRNRRLLRKITQTKTLEEQNKAMADQRRIHEQEIQNLTVSLRLVQEENQKFKQEKESNEYKDLVMLRSTLQANKDLEEANIGLKNLLITQREDHDKLKNSWQETKSDLLNAQKELDILKNQSVFNHKLKEQVFKLQKEVLLMGELQQKYHEKLHNQRNSMSVKPDVNYLAQSLKAEIRILKEKLNSASGKLEMTTARVFELDELLQNKELGVSEIKRNLEQTKVSHADEVQAINDKYNAMVHINQQLESELLTLQCRVDQLTLKCQLQQKGVTPVISCPSKTESDCSEGNHSHQSNDSIKTVTNHSEEDNESPKVRVARSVSDAVLQEQQLRLQNSQALDSLSFSSQDGASGVGSGSVSRGGSRSSIVWNTDSEDNRSNTTTDSGWWEKSTVSK